MPKRKPDDGTVGRTVCFRLLPDPAQAAELVRLMRGFQAVRRSAFRIIARGGQFIGTKATRKAQAVKASGAPYREAAPFYEKYGLTQGILWDAVADAEETLKRTASALLERLPRMVRRADRRVAHLVRLAETAPTPAHARKLRRLARRARRARNRLEFIMGIGFLAGVYRACPHGPDGGACLPCRERRDKLTRDDKKSLRRQFDGLLARMAAGTVFGGRPLHRDLGRLSRKSPGWAELKGLWRLRRASRFARTGRAREPGGNDGFRFAWDAGTVEIEVAPRRWIAVPFRSAHRDLPAFREAVSAATPLPWRAVVLRRCKKPRRHAETSDPCPACRFYLHASFVTPAPKEYVPERFIGVDVNAADRFALAWAEATACGNLRACGRIGAVPTRRERRSLARRERRRLRRRTTQGVTRRNRPVWTAARRRKFLERAALVVVRRAFESRAALVLEDGVFPQKPMRGAGRRAVRRLLGRWPVRTTHELIVSAARRYGVPVLWAPARHSSVVGLAKYAPLHNLSVHVGAALVLARLGRPASPKGRCPSAVEVERLPRAWALELSASGPSSSRGVAGVRKASEARGRRSGSSDPDRPASRGHPPRGPEAGDAWSDAGRRCESRLRAPNGRMRPACTLKAFLCRPAQPPKGVCGGAGDGGRVRSEPPSYTTGGRMQVLPIPDQGPSLSRGP